MRQFKLICADCRKVCIEEADYCYDIPGVQGELVTSSGSYVKFIDSTEPRYCRFCKGMTLMKNMEQMKGETNV